MQRKLQLKLAALFYSPTLNLQQRATKDYNPSKERIKHVNEILKLLEVLNNDKWFAEIDIDDLKRQNGEGGMNMCVALDKIEDRGFARGIEQGLERGIEQGKEHKSMR